MPWGKDRPLQSDLEEVAQKIKPNLTQSYEIQFLEDSIGCKFGI